MSPTSIEWTDESWKWCTACKATHPISAFGLDRSRSSGIAACCLESRRVKVRRPRPRLGRRGWQAPTRNGDKRQARRRINYLVEQKLIPHPNELPCHDCGDRGDGDASRHEYDHARGYDGENQLYVEAVCSRCHHRREERRRVVA